MAEPTYNSGLIAPAEILAFNDPGYGKGDVRNVLKRYSSDTFVVPRPGRFGFRIMLDCWASSTAKFQVQTRYMRRKAPQNGVSASTTMEGWSDWVGPDQAGDWTDVEDWNGQYHVCTDRITLDYDDMVENYDKYYFQVRARYVVNFGDGRGWLCSTWAVRYVSAFFFPSIENLTASLTSNGGDVEVSFETNLRRPILALTAVDRHSSYTYPSVGPVSVQPLQSNDGTVTFTLPRRMFVESGVEDIFALESIAMRTSDMEFSSYWLTYGHANVHGTAGREPTVSFEDNDAHTLLTIGEHLPKPASKVSAVHVTAEWEDSYGKHVIDLDASGMEHDEQAGTWSCLFDTPFNVEVLYTAYIFYEDGLFGEASSGHTLSATGDWWTSGDDTVRLVLERDGSYTIKPSVEAVATTADIPVGRVGNGFGRTMQASGVLVRGVDESCWLQDIEKFRIPRVWSYRNAEGFRGNVIVTSVAVGTSRDKGPRIATVSVSMTEVQ